MNKMNKAPPGRSRPKKSSHPPPGELVALGNQEKPKGAGAAGSTGSKKPAASSVTASASMGGPSAPKRPRVNITKLCLDARVSGPSSLTILAPSVMDGGI